MHEADLLTDIGAMLYGPNWRTPLSAALGVGSRTMARWYSGSRSIPQEVWADIAMLVAERGRPRVAKLFQKAEELATQHEDA